MAAKNTASGDKREKAGELDPRERRAVRNRMAGMTKGAALRAAGYSPATANSNCKDIFDRLEDHMDVALAEAGLTPEEFSKDIQKLRDAAHVRLTTDGETFEVPDNQAQIQALNIWAKVAGYEKPKRHEHEVTATVKLEEKRRIHEATVNRIQGYLE